MAVKLVDLLTNEERELFSIVYFKEQPVHIFYPKVSEHAELLSIFDDLHGSDTPKDADEVRVIKEIYPMLTDLDLSDIDDDMILRIIKSNSNVIEKIMADILIVIKEVQVLVLKKQKIQLLNGAIKKEVAESEALALEQLSAIDKLISNYKSTEELQLKDVGTEPSIETLRQDAYNKLRAEGKLVDSNPRKSDS